MKREKYFTYREAENNKVIIVPNEDVYFPMNTVKGGSYAVAPARCLGLSYAQYLIFLRTMFPNSVEIYGKDKKYPTVYWKKGKEMYTFIDLLNNKITLALSEIKLRDKEKE